MLDSRDHRVLQAQQVLLDHRDSVGLKVTLDSQALREQQDPKEFQASLASMVIKDHSVLQVL